MKPRLPDEEPTLELPMMLFAVVAGICLVLFFVFLLHGDSP
jgi:hypothetical protein